MARDFSVTEPIADERGLQTRPFAAWLRERQRETDASSATLDALIAHLIAEAIIPPDWNE